MVSQASTLLGVGLYTPAEAALYARVSAQLMSRWVFGTSDGSAVINRQLSSDEKIVTFLDFIQTLAIRAIRMRKRVPLDNIRDGIKTVEEKYGITYPLARQHTLFLMGDHVIIELPGHPREYVQVSGVHKHNRMITPVAEFFMEDISYDAVTGLARKFTIFKYDDNSVVMDPTQRFGEPLVAACGYSASTLAHAFITEGGAEQAAEAYGVEVKHINVACRFADFLFPPPPA